MVCKLLQARDSFYYLLSLVFSSSVNKPSLIN